MVSMRLYANRSDADFKQARDRLQNVAHRLVRRVFLEDTPEAEALFTLAAGEKFDWTPTSWQRILDRLDQCELTIGEWLNDAAIQRLGTRSDSVH